MHISSKHPSLREFSSAPGGAISPQSAGLFQLRCQQPHGQVELPHDIHDPGNRSKLYRSFAANESDSVRALLKNFFEPGRETIPGNGLVIDFERSVFSNLNDDDAFVTGRLYRPFRGLGQVCIQPGLVMRHDHEDHHHYQENIHQRNDIHVGRQTAITANLHSHESPRMNCLREDSHIQRTKKTAELLPCFELGGDQANLVDSGAAHDVNGASHVHEERFVVALDERDFLRTFLEDLLDARTQLIPTGIFLIDLDLAVFRNLDNDSLIFQLDVLLLIGIRLRHEGIETLRDKRRDHHENDDQHQKNINQRYYVGRCERAALLSNFHPHGVIS